ncbi:MAG: TIGR01777 family oxidoreductase [Acidobacteriota bacterium]
MADAKKLIVTGGSGLIGRALTADLTARGWQVVILSRRPERVRGLPAGARAVGWDGRSADGWKEEVDGADGIVHLAGENVADGRWTAAKKRRLRDSRIESSRAVMAAVEAVETKPSFLLQSSAVGFYGDSGEVEIDETSPPGDDFLADLSVEWEATTAAAEDLGVRRAILRTGIVLARDGGALPKMALPYKLGFGGPVGSGRQYVPWIHLADEVAAIRFLIEHPTASGPFNLTAPSPVTNAELGATLARVLRRPNLVPAPAFALRAVFGEMARLLLGGQKAFPRALEGLGFEFQFGDLESALRDLLKGEMEPPA